jgi:hypothetical protein
VLVGRVPGPASCSSSSSSGTRPLLLLCVVQLPGHGVEEPDQAGLADAPAEERVGGQRAEGVVADLGIGGRGAAVDKVEVGVGLEDGGVE